MEFTDYLSECTSPYKTVEITSALLKNAGYSELSMSDKWKLEKGRGYYVRIYETCAAVFYVGDDYADGGRMIISAAHTDQPCLRIKPGKSVSEGGYLKLNVEVYGGAIINTWLDRPLSISGIVAIRDGNKVKSRLVDLKRPVLTIPNLAIHMNRDVNKGIEINKQTELMPLFGLAGENLSKDDALLRLLSGETGCKAEDILSFDLCVYNCDKPQPAGMDNEFISAPRIDNLSSCYACVMGLINSQNAETLNIAMLFDNEETGSVSKQGADSDIAGVLVRKIYKGLQEKYGDSFDIDSIDEACFKSLMLSVDVAHAYHPNYGGKYDPVCRCIMGSGPALKLNYTQKYATDVSALSIVKLAAEKKGIKLQEFMNRSDIAGGGTLGSMLSSHLPMRCVDMGIGILAMHSARELMSGEDEENLQKLITSIYSQNDAVFVESICNDMV